MRSTAADAGSSKPSMATAATKATRCTPPAGRCAPAGLLTDKQKDRLTGLLAADQHVEVGATWGIYQRRIGAYREPDRAKGRDLMVKLIDSVSSGVPAALVEIITLRRTLKKRAEDVLAHFDRPGTSSGPTEAINGRLEHLRGSALGFRNLTTARACWRPAAPDRDYTLDWDEPVSSRTDRSPSARVVWPRKLALRPRDEKSPPGDRWPGLGGLR
jgi:hypothetical protein